MKNRLYGFGLATLMGLFALASCNPAPEDNSSGAGPSGGGGDQYAEASDGASGAKSYVTDPAKRAEILGKLEKYAMDTKLAGIPILGNSTTSFVHKRVSLPKGTSGTTLGYVTGYGTGLLKEGSIDPNAAFSSEPGTDAFKNYLHSFDSQAPTSVNALNGNDTRISGFYDYISSSFYSTRLVKADGYDPNNPQYKNEFEWYPVLAKITSRSQDGKPQPVENGKQVAYDASRTYSTWRIYVKTGDDGLKYTTLSTKRGQYNGTPVKIEDYIFALKVLINQKTGYYRSSSYISGTGEIQGAAKYYNATKAVAPIADDYSAVALPTSEGYLDGANGNIDGNWNGVGYKAGYDPTATGADNKGSYFVDVSFNVPTDQFNAMYQISDSNIEPINAQFFKDVTGLKDGGEIGGYTPLNYGNTVGQDKPVDTILSLGAYTLENWNDTEYITYKRNPEWIETKENPAYYRIEGVFNRISSTAENDPYYGQKRFTLDDGYLDSTTKPGDTTEYDNGLNQKGNRIDTPATTNWKLSVNSANQEQWNAMFGPDGTVSPHADQFWNVKPIMSNSDFLNGVFFSIDRKTIADKIGMSPAYEYFSDAYYIDPINRVVYNDTPAHQEAISQYAPDKNGYDIAVAQNGFKKAVQTLLGNGQIKAGDTIALDALWMTQANINQFGNAITQNIVSAFNEAAKAVDGNNPVKLEIRNSVPAKGDVYTPIGEGKFDFAFASLTGMNYNPLNMMEVMKSDNSSGFTLNWGIDTSKNYQNAPYRIEYDGGTWSFDGLWNAAVYGVTVQNGKVTLPYVFDEKKSGFITKFNSTQTQVEGLTYRIAFDINKDLEAKADMKVQSIQANITFYGKNSTPYSLSAELVPQDADLSNDPTKVSNADLGQGENVSYDSVKIKYTRDDATNTITADIDLFKLYFYSKLTRRSDGTVNTFPKLQEIRSAIGDINDGSNNRALAMNANYTVAMTIEGSSTVSNLRTIYNFTGAKFTQ